MGGGRRSTRSSVNNKNSQLSIFGSAQDLFTENIPSVRKTNNTGRQDTEKKSRTNNNEKSKTKKSTCPPEPVSISKTKAAVPVPPKCDILMAVKSLYADRLRPFGRILRKRLAERSDNDDSSECDLMQLKKVCEECDTLAITSEEGGEWSALLVSQMEDFVDVYDKSDDYPVETWLAADTYFQNLPDSEAVLPGGRYACAQTLANRNLDFLRGYTLGHICHFVQLAISTRKILGYLNGGVTSYHRSHSCAKDKAAAEQSACAQTSSVSELELASWAIARKCLRIIMKDALNSQANQVPLSNIKRIFRSQFETELSETSLGHSKLSELLQDERLHDICTVRLLEQGYFVIPTFEISDSQSDGQSTESTAFSWADIDDEFTTSDNDGVDELADAFCETPCWDDWDETHGIKPNCDSEVHLAMNPEPFADNSRTEWFALSPRARVRNTFIHAPTTPLVSAPRQRSQSLPRSVGKSCLESPSLSSPSIELMVPPTPEMCSLKTPELWTNPAPAGFDYGLQSVPESQAVECRRETFSWSAINAPVDVALQGGLVEEQFHAIQFGVATYSAPESDFSSIALHCPPDFSVDTNIEQFGWRADSTFSEFPYIQEDVIAAQEQSSSAVQISLADHV